MTNKLPPYVKLFSADPAPTVAPESKVPGMVTRISDAFEKATGWQLDSKHSGNSGATDRDWSERSFAVAEAATDVSVPREDADLLADQISDLLTELKRTQRKLWQSEGELAAAIPLVSRPEDEPFQLAERLQAILKGIADAVSCQAAGLYLLDDDTRYLKLRASYGLPAERLTADPRRLRGCRADLEALTGHAVVLEKTDRVELWCSPEEYASAICIPVSTATVPLGTLWIFGQSEQSYSDAQVNMAEIVAGRLACELEREILLRERAEFDGAPAAHFGDVATAEESEKIDSNESAFASPKTLIDGWKIATTAATGQPALAAGQSFTSYEFADGRLSLTLGQSHEAGLEGALTAASVGGAAQLVRAILAPAQRLHRINDALSALSTGDKACSLVGLTIRPNEGELEFSSAGEADTFVIRPHGWELLSQPAPAIGITADAEYDNKSTHLEPSDLLLSVSAPSPRASRRDSERYLDAKDLAELTLRHHHLSPAQLTELIETMLDSKPHVWPHPPSVMILQRS